MQSTDTLDVQADVAAGSWPMRVSRRRQGPAGALEPAVLDNQLGQHGLGPAGRRLGDGSIRAPSPAMAVRLLLYRRSALGK